MVFNGKQKSVGEQGHYGCQTRNYSNGLLEGKQFIYSFRESASHGRTVQPASQPVTALWGIPLCWKKRYAKLKQQLFLWSSGKSFPQCSHCSLEVICPSQIPIFKAFVKVAKCQGSEQPGVFLFLYVISQALAKSDCLQWQNLACFWHLRTFCLLWCESWLLLQW